MRVMRLLALVVMVMLLSAGLPLVGGCQQPAPERGLLNLLRAG